MLTGFHPLLANGASTVGGEVLERGRVTGRGHDDDGVVEGAEVLQDLDGLGDRGVLLTDGDVDALHALALLVQDRVDGDRRLAGLAVADDQLALTATHGRHGVDGLDAGLQGLGDWLATGDARRLDLHAAQLGVNERSLAVDGFADGVHHPSEQRVTDGHVQDSSGRAHDLFLFDGVDRAEHDGADGVLVEVHRETQRAVFELEQLVDLGRRETGDARDAVADLDDATDLLGADGRIELRHVLAQGLGDLVGADGELCHHRFLFLSHFDLKTSLIQVTRRDGVAKFTQARAGRRVQSKVTDLDEDSAEQFGAVGNLEFHVLAGE